MHLSAVSDSLFQAIMQYGTVSVRHVGTLWLESSHASFFEKGTRLSPPATIIAFRAATDSNYSLSLLLAEQGEEPVNAQAYEQFLSEHITRAWAAGTTWTLPGIGSFEKNSFVPENDSVFNRYDGLESVQVPSVKAGETASGVSVQGGNRKSEPSGDIPAWLFWLLVIGVIATLLFIVRVMPQVPDSVPQNTTPVRRAPGNKQEMKTGFSNTLPSAESVAETGKCTVIVGAFRLPDNADKMKQRIREAGYDVFEQDVNGLRRVGAVLSCQSNQPVSARETARQQFDKQAWLLTRE